MGRKAKNTNDSVSLNEINNDGFKYRCTACGFTSDDPVGVFYKNKWSPIYKSNNCYVTLCRTCVNNMFKDYENKYGTEMATLLICQKLDFPFYYKTYNDILVKNNVFNIGLYARVLNNRQYQYQDFSNTILSNELAKSKVEVKEEIEAKWTKEELQNKQTVIDLVGYDPFESYEENERIFLFSDLIKYFDDDLEDDAYKLSQILIIVDNNNQVRKINKLIASLNPLKDKTDIKDLIDMRSKIIKSTNDIAKENEISVHTRTNKNVGKGTLTDLMRELREKDFDKAEADYYDQLTSAGTKWGIDMSIQSILEHTLFDENDKKDVYEENIKLIQNLYKQLDDATEKIRELNVIIDKYKNNYESIK